MDWNKPSEKPKVEAAAGVSSFALIRGLIAAGVVAVGAGTAWYVLGPGGGSGEGSGRGKTSRLIKEATPQIPKSAQVQPQESQQEIWKKKGYPQNPWGTPIPKDLEYKPHWKYTAEDYARIDPGYEERHKKHLEALKKIPWQTAVDADLANLMFPKDGDPGMMNPFDAGFKRKFLKSLSTPIIATKDDSDEVREQKRQMNELKIELKARYDNGEDVTKLLSDEYERMKKVNSLRENLQRELRELEKTATSVEEVEDFVKAANIMLDKEGGASVGLPIARTRYRLNRQKQQTENQ